MFIWFGTKLQRISGKFMGPIFINSEFCLSTGTLIFIINS